MKPVSVLFVDDEEQILNALGRLVRTREWPAHFCSSPEEALELVSRRRDIGVVVSDHSMPGMTGVELLCQVRQARPLVQRVLLTGNADHAVLADAINSGAVFRYVSKPWSETDLLLAIDAAVDQAELLRENRRLRILARRRTRQLQQSHSRLEVTVSHRTRKLAEANVKLRDAAVGLVRLLAVSAEGVDPAMSGHGELVARHSVAIGRRMNLEATELDDLRLAATLHDVGKVHESPASGFELEAMHAETGSAMLEPLPFSRSVVEAVRHHHERWDGRGTPCGLRGAAIPKLARIVAVADAFAELLRSDEGETATESEAAARLIMTAGREHDPEVVAALVGAVAGASSRADVHESELDLVGTPS